jgi:uncharacterized OsmC-like protein
MHPVTDVSPSDLSAVRQPATERIRTAIDRSLRAVALRPTVGRGTAVTLARLEDGLRCTVSQGRWSFAMDMSPKVGGTGTAPNPGVFARGALASCLAVGYASWAARLGVELRGVEVRVEADYDVRGELGAGGGRPGYLEIRYTVELDAGPEVRQDTLDHIMDLGDRHSSLRDVFATGVPLRRVEAPKDGSP